MPPKIRKFWISREELLETITAQQFPIGGFTIGSIPFADATGILTEDNAALSWHAANETLEITSATTLLLDLDPGFTGTGEVINITPSAALDTEDAEWDGINIDGNLLDPSAIGCFIHGIHLDFSTVDTTNSPHIDALHIQMPTMAAMMGLHAIHTNCDYYVEFDVGSFVAGQTATTFDVNIITAGATGGEVHALDVARTGGGTIATTAVGTHTGIDVIHQHIGTATAFDKVWEFNGGWTDITAECGNPAADVAIWEAQDDIVYFGHATVYDEIECIFAIAATKSMHFDFHYSDAGGWTEFFPADDTNGAQVDGLIRWLASDIPAWSTETVNAVANKYWIRITRTRLVGTGPTEDTIKFILGTTYSWDKVGAITALSLSAGQITDTGVTATNIAAGTTGQRPGGVVGDIRYNSTLGGFEAYTGAWENIILSGDNPVSAAANIADHSIVRGDGGAKGIQQSTAFITDAGETTNPSQPAFAYYNSAPDLDVTGDATPFTVIFDTEIFDQGGNFDGTSTFTAPVTGKYQLTTIIAFADLDTDSFELIQIRINTTKNPFDVTMSSVNNHFLGYIRLYLTVLVEMDANDTATVIILAAGGTKTVNAYGAAVPNTIFMGNLVV